MRSIEQYRRRVVALVAALASTFVCGPTLASTSELPDTGFLDLSLVSTFISHTATAIANVGFDVVGPARGPSASFDDFDTESRRHGDRWFSSLYAGWYREVGANLAFDERSWVNQVNLAKPGENPVDVGLYLEIERPSDRTEGYNVVWGPSFRVDAGRVQLSTNVWLGKSVHALPDAPIEATYQWQARTPVVPQLDIGVQGFGNVGPWARWSPGNEQQHLAGPAVFVQLPVGDGRQLNLDTAMLAGLTPESPRYTFRLRTLIQF